MAITGLAAFMAGLDNLVIVTALPTISTGLGYLGAGLILVAQLVIYLGHNAIGIGEAPAVRLCFLLSGLWWALFSIRPLCVLRRYDPANRPEWTVGQHTISLPATVRTMTRHPIVLRFLIAFFVYTAGINTVNAVASQYGEREIGLTEQTLVPILVTVQFVGALGAWLHGKLALRLGTHDVDAGLLRRRRGAAVVSARARSRRGQVSSMRDDRVHCGHRVWCSSVVGEVVAHAQRAAGAPEGVEFVVA